MTKKYDLKACPYSATFEGHIFCKPSINNMEDWHDTKLTPILHLLRVPNTMRAIEEIKELQREVERLREIEREYNDRREDCTEALMERKYS